MCVSKRALTVFLAGVCGVASAQSIDELSDLNRQAMLADARAKLEKKKDLPAPAPNGAPLGAPGAAGAPLPMPVAQKRVSAPQKAALPPAPELVAIYGVGGRLITELNDRGFEGKYREGDRTPSGWTVSKIDRRQVAMTRPQKKAPGFETVSLPFGVKLEEPKEKEKEVSPTSGGGFSMPPIPTSFPALMK